MRYPLRHAVKCVHPVGFEPTPPERLGLKSNAFLARRVDERPTRPRIQMCRKYFVRDSDRVRTRIDLVRIDPATLAGVDFKSTALTTRPHYLAQVPFRGRPTRESNPEPSDVQSVQILCGVVRRAVERTQTTPTGLEPATPRFEV